MFKKMMTVFAMVLTLVSFANLTEAAKEVKEIHEVVVQEVMSESTGRGVRNVSIVEIDGQTYKKVEKIDILDRVIEEYHVRYVAPNGSIKMVFRWREKNGKYVKSPNDNPVRIVTEKR